MTAEGTVGAPTCFPQVSKPVPNQVRSNRNYGANFIMWCKFFIFLTSTNVSNFRQLCPKHPTPSLCRVAAGHRTIQFLFFFPPSAGLLPLFQSSSSDVLHGHALQLASTIIISRGYNHRERGIKRTTYIGGREAESLWRRRRQQNVGTIFFSGQL
jgi:hypothetical protein